jgi:hypothetical protein
MVATAVQVSTSARITAIAARRRQQWVDQMAGRATPMRNTSATVGQGCSVMKAAIGSRGGVVVIVLS